MTKRIFIALAAFMLTVSGLSAQNLLRYNYKKNGYVYTGTERLRVPGSQPIQLKLSRIALPDGASVYILRMDFEDAAQWSVPKNASLKVSLSSGKTLVSKNELESNVVAPKGVKTDAGTVYWNGAEYYFEENDIAKMTSGVSAIEAVRRFSSDGGNIKVTYKNDEFANALYRQYQAITGAPVPQAELGDNIKSLQDFSGSRTAQTKTVSVDPQLSVSLSYLYYADTNNENYDLNLYLNGKEVPIGTSVTLVTASGTTINLQQEKDLPGGYVVCYPTVAQLKEIAGGVSRLTIRGTETIADISLRDSQFAETVKSLYHSLQRVAIL